ncbi:MAG: adenylate kinase [Bacilli bacterium]|nr:adenylate kinase [Bacilli bacterium]
MKNIIFLAPPAAGKGTLSEMLVEKFGYGHISTGDLLREEIKNKTEVGKQAESLMKEGKFVSDDVIIELISKRIIKEDCDNGYILDGFPRTLKQAEKYDELLKKLNKDLGVVIYLDIEKERAMKRACGRMTCPSCGKIYHKYSPEMKPKHEGKCDVCNVDLSSRSDDNEETFNKRFDEYVTKTMPLYDYYNNKGVLRIVKAHESKYDTFNDAVKVIED